MDSCVYSDVTGKFGDYDMKWSSDDDGWRWKFAMFPTSFLKYKEPRSDVVEVHWVWFEWYKIRQYGVTCDVMFKEGLQKGLMK